MAIALSRRSCAQADVKDRRDTAVVARARSFLIEALRFDQKRESCSQLIE
jgi:hypothetical protein